MKTATSWISHDGRPMLGLRMSHDSKWLIAIHPFWWAAKRNEPPLHGGVAMCEIDFVNRWVRAVSAVPVLASDVSLIDGAIYRRYEFSKLRRWADSAIVSRHPECGFACHDFVADNYDTVQQSVYTSVARFLPWRTRIQRDVLAAALSTAPNGTKNVWATRTHAYIPGGGGFITMTSGDWMAQIQSVSNPRCQDHHNPADDSCKLCDRSDAEFWLEPGDAVA